MNDQPSAEELLRAVERFLEHEVVPRLEGVPKFHARVAANVVAMVAREIETADAHERGEWLRLGELLGRQRGREGVDRPAAVLHQRHGRLELHVHGAELRHGHEHRR